MTPPWKACMLDEESEHSASNGTTATAIPDTLSFWF